MTRPTLNSPLKTVCTSAAALWLSAEALLAPQASAQPAAPAKPASAAPNLPSADCLKVLDTLASTIPKEESLVELRRKGLRLAVPLLPQGVVSPAVASGVVLRMKVDVDGKPVPGSIQVMKTQGDDSLVAAVQAAVSGMVFDLTHATGLNFPFPFSTTYVSCARR